MQDNGELQALIHSMSPQERYQFTHRFADPDSYYMVLFNRMVETPEPDDQELQKLLQEKGSRQKVSKVRVQLKNKLFHFLVSQNIVDKKGELQLRIQDRICSILFARGLPNNLAKRYEAMVNKAIESANYDVARSAIWSSYLQDSLTFEEVKEKVRFNRELARLENILNKVRDYDMLLKGYKHNYHYYTLNNPRDWEQVQQLYEIDQFVQQSFDDPSISGMLRQTINNFKLEYFKIIFDKEKAYETWHQMMLHYNQLPDSQKRATNYPGLRSLILWVARDFSDYTTFYQQYPLLVADLENLDNRNYSDFILQQAAALYAVIDDNRKATEAYFDMQKPYIEAAGIYTKKKVPAGMAITHVPIYMLFEDKEKALADLNDQLMISKIGGFLEVHSRFRIDELMLLADSGAYELIAPKVDSYRKWLANNMPNKPKDGVEQLFIKYFPKIFVPSQHSNKELLQELQEQLQPFGEKHPILYNFCGGFIPWIQSKLERRSLWDVVQDRVKAALVK